MSQEQDMTGIPSPTKESSKSIQAIDREAVHRICSGQVVLNLATAVKELVENSLDAGATSIEIRLREYGSELVEVVDNGCGVEEANFEGLTLKHHTSKLREFSDLLGVETFGFRGEALSSLCALSDLTVTTRHSSSNMGTKLTYDSHGSIVSKSPCARQVGTSIALANLFSPLPVRQKEFHRNLKREFVKMSQLLHAYCLISTGVKISCSNQTKKGKSVVVSTQGSPTFKGNIMCIFGAKQASSLLDIELEVPSVHHLEEIGLPNNIEIIRFELEGCISSCAHGQGRSSTDRQFYFINNRPCDPSKVSKVVNEVYHQFNLHQFPFIFLNIKTARDSVDINVTPDKRQIFLDNEKLLIATVKASLLKLYEKIPNTYQVQNVAIGPTKSTSDIGLSDSCTQISGPSSPTTPLSNRISSFSSLLKKFGHSASKTETNEDSSSFSPRDYSNMKTGRGVKRTLNSSNYDRDGKKQLCLSDFVSQKKTDSIKLEENDALTPVPCGLDTLNGTNGDISNCISYNQEENNLTVDTVCSKPCIKTVCTSPKATAQQLIQSSLSEIEAHNNEINLITTIEHSERQKDALVAQNLGLEKNIVDIQEPALDHLSELPKLENCDSQSIQKSTPVLIDVQKSGIKQKSVALNVNMDKLRIRFNKYIKRSKDGDSVVHGKPRVRFYTEIDPSKNKTAEQELNKEISKDMFSKMEILGQFNLGFIITKLGHDLFIVDQHATDEKYNFEKLQSQTILKNQKLVISQALDLTAVNECILMDNLEIFLKNGFDFVIDNNAEPTKRVRLAAKPISHNWEFGKEDIDELLFMLQDSPHTMCRPSRVRAMFASRACRKSVMIGTALSKSTMRQLITHMGEIEQPWNCPHGRPTMRHLVNLELVRKKKRKIY